MLEKLRIGLIVKPQGVRGELKVMSLTDDANRYKKLKKVIIDNREYTVSSVKIAVDSVILGLDEVKDRNTAELFRGKYVEVDRQNAVSLSNDKFFIADLVGLNVVDFENNNYGKIIDIIKNRTDIISIENNGKKGYFPFIKALDFKVDLTNNLFIVNGSRLKEIIVYED